MGAKIAVAFVLMLGAWACVALGVYRLIDRRRGAVYLVMGCGLFGGSALLWWLGRVG